MIPSDCCQSVVSPLVIQTPGPQGATGPAGAAGAAGPAGAAGATGATGAAGKAAKYGTCYTLIGANFNSTADQGITGLPAKYIIRAITVVNASVNLTTAQGGFYTGAGKSGTTVVASTQAYTALTGATKWLDLTLNTPVTTDVCTSSTLYFALTTAQGVAATADIFVMVEDLT